MKVIRSDGTIEKFKPQKIKDNLIEETNISGEEAERIKNRIDQQIKNMKKDEIFSSEIREVIKVSLMKYQEFKTVKEYDIISIPKDTIEGFLTSRNDINANSSFNSEAIGKSISDEIITEYTLRHILNKNERDAHTHGFIHIHDLSAFPTRLNCMSHDPRMFFEKGFYIEGDNGSGPYAKQPKTLTAVVNWLREIMAVSGQEAFAGAQGISLFNVWLAPFVRGMEYKDVYQALQSFIFDMNFSLTRGGEALFSNLNIELCGVPKFMENKNAIGPGGLSVGVYGDYIKESQLVADIIIELLYKADGNGKFFIFPNLAFVMRNEAKNDDEYKKLFEKACSLQAKFPVFYFINADIENEGGHSVVWGCRSNLSSNWTGDPEIDTLRTGNSSFITLNLPRYSHLAEDENDIYSLIDKYMDIGMDIMLKRDELFKQNWNNGMYKFISQLDSNKEPYYKLENATHAWGYLGCEEMLKNLGIENGMIDTEGQKIVHNILDHLNTRKKEFSDNTGLRTSIISSPAEYCTKRLADLDYNEFGKNINIAGNKNNRYYTNSYHILGQDIDLLEKIRIESQYHASNGGGAIIHTWLAQFPNHKALMDLFNLQKEFGCKYMTTTNSFTYCNDCHNNSNNINEICPSCNSNETISFDKICFGGDTKIIIKYEDKIENISLENFVKKYDPSDNYETISYNDKDEKYEWKKITDVTYKDSYDLYKVDLTKGYSVLATPNHEFFKGNRGKYLKKIRLEDLNIGDTIRNHQMMDIIDVNSEENLIGTFIGFYLGDGSVSNGTIKFAFHKEEKARYLEDLLKKIDIKFTQKINYEKRYGCNRYDYFINTNNRGNIAYDSVIINKNKNILPTYYSEKYLKGILIGLINSDGSVYIENRSNSIVTQFSCSNLIIKEFFEFLCNIFGLNQALSIMDFEDNRNRSYRFEIRSIRMFELLRNSTLRNPFNFYIETSKCISDKTKKLTNSTIKNIEYIGKDEVYCISVKDNENSIFNGILAGNTGYISAIPNFNSSKQQEVKDRKRYSV